MRFNTAISAMMVFANEATAWAVRPGSVLQQFLILLQPFAPHLAEELWSKLTASLALAGVDTSLGLAYQPWPGIEAQWLVEDTIEVPVQVNGKLRDVLRLPAAATAQEMERAALGSEKVQPFLAGKTVKKVIVVPKKLVNIAVG
jgi:leucyl-tRNA synthetase